MTERVDTACPITRAAELVGDRWTLQILRHATVGVTRFDQFRIQLGIADNVLANRLSRLVSAGLLVKQPYHDGRRTRQEYRLSTSGADTLPVLHALVAWGNKHADNTAATRPMSVVHRRCGSEISPGDFCHQCDRHVVRGEIVWLRPWVSDMPFALAEPVDPTTTECWSGEAMTTGTA